MIFILLGFLCALIGALPLLARKKYQQFFWQFSITGFLAAWFFYCETPSTVYPIFGAYGAMVLICFVISAIVDSNSNEYNEDLPFSVLLPTIGLVTIFLLN